MSILCLESCESALGLCVTVGDRVPPRPAVYRGGRRSVFFHMYRGVQDHTVDLALQRNMYKGVVSSTLCSRVSHEKLYDTSVDLASPFSCLSLAHLVGQAPEEAASP